ncbi:ATP-dependent DNA helicase RecG [Terriglobus saanensis]|uniref:Probable DNA 3'-5' helicase RecG n=1 Tax=Terriglobus saanensis (strain ATCC BAA-1853 / DSM 23119 / SP1PR4) TaxID=401053 RepID=E8V155_TERSS|nr:ATP-dependent DNA helicase RecG [Terriglobus saanensis]ADV83403.1 ATP-dependent DNA helicase RecG [Terriglobus saanensis SP1PR4]
MDLSTHVKFVKGVGERNAAALVQRGVETVEDLLYHLPFRYEDRLHPRPIAELKAGEMASVIGEVRGSVLLHTRSMPLFEMTVAQGVDTVKAMWFRGTYLKDKFKLGQTVALYGKMEPSRSNAGKFKMLQPQFEILPEPGEEGGFEMLEMGRIVPVYETLGGTTAWGAKLGSKWMRRVVWDVLEELGREGTLDEPLPGALRKKLGLMDRLEALRRVHFPEAGTSMVDLQSSATPAHRRLIFEELFYLELGLELKRKRMRERTGVPFTTGTKVREAIKRVLPFHPTPAQKRVLGEIVADMQKPQPMRRLLQGDVGSGKTIVAMQAAIVAIENGYQAALMAPTEILATQHYLSAKKLLGDSYTVTLLTGSLDAQQKRLNRRKIFAGESELVVGTQALIQEKVDFANLGLVIVDEQHRFGVRQRFTLMKKPGTGDPDVLVMTATPIPRTLAMTVYGDLDVSVLDELPPGRTPIVTRRTGEERSEEVWAFVLKQVKMGRQAYIVYPMIEGAKEDQPELDFAVDPPAEVEEPKKRAAKKATKPKKLFSEKTVMRSATEMYDHLRAGALRDIRLGLLHGKLSADEKEVTMRRFQRGEIDVLVATTVIEVGVDVPNASVMVIEHAERFGMAQMHQLRGRVGRGAAKSYCILVTGARVSPQAEERVGAMVRTQNGFELAELDLAQRGPGEFFGTRQAGMPDFRVASLLRDRDLLEMAKKEAARFIERPYDVPEVEREMVRSQLKHQWQRRYGLVEA